ncbi:glycosyl hydrolase family 32 [Cryobacterium sp. PH31-O1]|uniref:glycosyl hydrolase family 32 n=1 Tax=Cryobacterium sp. PH31-O1 TaxID=3046306 RepID=UPI0024B8ED99|nr:glycosyl hydrolase family 32 [Cryobacterium sp. PH31-O1]MDJ0338348.1 glycosyl hydrolase family 32 [Cryobacterium sp. PH31-O1]
MTLELSDHWVWDNWVAHNGDDQHLFFLRASRALIDPDRRHHRAAIGHAVSQNLRTWTLLPDALVHSDGPAFDDLATWTGSVIQAPDGTWRLFYTGISRAERGLTQRIGWATSPDLIEWTRMTSPALEADPRWYETLGEGTWPDEAWRDPFVFEHEGLFHMFITARSNLGDPDGRGVVGHATSPDLDTWTVLEPLTNPAGFGQMEVVQARIVNGTPSLLFSCGAADASVSAAFGDRATATWVARGETLLGPWDMAGARPVQLPSLYAAQFVRDREEWALMGFTNEVDGVFVGSIIDPIPWSDDLLG